jgi:hypothetical protein
MSIKRLVPVLVVTLASPIFASSPQVHDADQSQHASHVSPPSLVELVQQVTRPFRDVRRAIAVGYGQFLGCVSGPQEGAMGIHFVNAYLVGDGELDVNQPEALIYEAKNGTLRLLGVEFIVMADAWHANHEEPPVLEGQLFQYNASPNRYGLPAFYELHVWAWRDNPNGAFVDWHPLVSCQGQ